ncbi:endonuclease/exonuclease/phosphatase family protein [Luteimonas aestuarii]|uniref:Endonuclease/exonuclease/phosphatase family protein n=1 Tax=Luteimonas aestuarii TaxID=453837 RepID=A0A4V3AN00_9GAMM|nr:endonuclease/exonuclease/phosphatase family protein [Luteimonas aestuarii]TDK28735.1 endonuclease/exonuclease/phosphatase family protein [Luteimonas aestuarii]
MYRPLFRLLLASLLCAGCMAAHAQATPSDAHSTVTVVTLNLYHDRDDWPKRRAQIPGVLGALRPDAIVLQEVLQHENLQNQAEWLAAELGYAVYFTSVDPEEKVHRYGNALLTPHPVLARDQVALEPRDDGRNAGMLRIDVRGQPVNIYVTHLHHTPGGAALRARQIDGLMEFITRTAGDAPSIVGGDFNALADAPELAALTGSGYIDSFGQLHPDASPEATTLNLAWFDTPRRIDHIYFQRGRFEALRSEILFTQPDETGAWASDHHGVLSEFAILPTGTAEAE